MSTIQHCESFGLELVRGIHDLSADTLKLALFTAAAGLGIATAAYGISNEIVVSGYTAGGKASPPSSGYPLLSGHVAQVRFDAVTWTFAASVTLRYGLLYNASKANRALMVIDLGGSLTATGAFTITFPLTVDPFITLRIPLFS